MLYHIISGGSGSDDPTLLKVFAATISVVILS